jgi:hypothetical protein
MQRLLLDERILGDGRHASTWATYDPGTLHVHLEDDDGTAGPLSIVAVDRVMLRYGLPLDAEIRLDGEALELGEGRRLRRLRHHAPVDATGRDYLVWERPDEAPLAVIATHATAALRYLVMRLVAERKAPSDF